jgi:hypothetical protein
MSSEEGFRRGCELEGALEVLARRRFVWFDGYKVVMHINWTHILVSTPRINTLSDWSLRRGAPTKKIGGVGDGGVSPK